MNILYVTAMSGPIQTLLRGGDEKDITSAKFFYYPWKMLVDRGHTVDFVMLSNFNEEYNIKVDWFSEKNIIKNIYAPHTEKWGISRRIRRLKRFFQLLYYTNKAVKDKHYDFIYCKAFEGVAGQIIANIHHIPCGVRSFGDHAWTIIKEQGAVRAAIKLPLEWLCYRFNGKFILMSEDHKDMRITYDEWHNKKYNVPFYLWPTGVEFIPLEQLKTEVSIPKEKYVFFAAHIEYMKRQDRVIEVLKLLHESGERIHLYFCGGIRSQSYYNRIITMVKEYRLDEYVHFIGVVSQDTLKLYAHNAVANVLMINGSSCNNVFFEIMTVGSVVVGLNDGGINDYLINGESGFLIEDEEQASMVIQELIHNSKLEEEVKKKAHAIAKERIPTAVDMFGKEVELIENSIIDR